jgi:hypothetical protein
MAKKTQVQPEVIEDTKAEEAPVEAPVVKAPSLRDQKVRVTLFQDSDKYKDDVVVGLNGKFWTIKRGVEVELPRNVWLVLEASLKQDGETAKMIQELSSKAARLDF